MTFRPLTLVIVYFLFLGIFSLFDPSLYELEWVMLNRFHNLIGLTAGFSFAFSNKPIDKGAISLLWGYAFFLFCFDWLIPTGYIELFAFAAAGLLAWLIYRRWTDRNIFSGKRTGRCKNNDHL